MMFSVKEICSIAGVTRKTLFYYDRIGLLEPTARSGKQNFKQYNEAAVSRLIEIRLYREMGLSIPMIQDILASDGKKQKQYLNEISKVIHEDIRKRSEDALIIDVLKCMTREELNSIIGASSGLDDLRACLLKLNRGNDRIKE